MPHPGPLPFARAQRTEDTPLSPPPRAEGPSTCPLEPPLAPPHALRAASSSVPARRGTASGFRSTPWSRGRSGSGAALPPRSWLPAAPQQASAFPASARPAPPRRRCASPPERRPPLWVSRACALGRPVERGVSRGPASGEAARASSPGSAGLRRRRGGGSGV